MRVTLFDCFGVVLLLGFGGLVGAPCNGLLIFSLFRFLRLWRGRSLGGAMSVVDGCAILPVIF